MKKAGIREVRQNLSALIDEVSKGREILITDRGRPVARLVSVSGARSKRFPGRSSFRRRMPTMNPPLSETVAENREDRI